MPIQENEEKFKFLLEAVAENIKESSCGHLEPFEEYVQTLRAKFYIDQSLACARFTKGYHVLLETLKANGI